MDRPSNLREALLADALGDLHKLLDRADKLVPAIDEACKALEESREALVASASIPQPRSFSANVSRQRCRSALRGLSRLPSCDSARTLMCTCGFA
jgi:hypothetical protein